MYEVIVFRNVTAFSHTMYIRDKHTGQLIGPDRRRHDTTLGAEPPAGAAWNIPDGAEHAMLGALAQALGAVEHPQQLRQDYLAERKRVDEMATTLQRLLLGQAGL